MTGALLTVKEVADYLGVTETTVYRWVDAGELTTIRLGPSGRWLRFRRGDVDDYVETKASR